MNRRGLIAIIAVVVLIVASGGLYLLMNQGDKKAPASTQQVTVYVATAAIPAGVTADKVRALAVAKQVAATAVTPGAINDLAQIEGRQVVVPIAAGEQLLASSFATADQAASAGQMALPSGTVELAVQLNALQSVGGQLKSGNTVSIFVTMTVGKTDSTDSKEATRRIASAVMVTKVISGGATTQQVSSPQTSPQAGATASPAATSSSSPTASPTPRTGAAASGSGTGMMLLLALTPNDAARLIMASRSGAITLARENDGSAVNSGQSATITVDKVLE